MKAARKSNFTLKWDNAPATYRAIFDGTEVRLRFGFVVGTLPLSVVVRQKMNNLPMADARPKGFDSEKIIKIIFSRNLGGLANNTKWNELITAVRANDEWRPSYRTKSVAGYISGWDCEWFYHLPFPFLCVEWFDISLESPSHINSNWVLNLVSKIGFEYEVKNGIIRVWGYGPKSYEDFN